MARSLNLDPGFRYMGWSITVLPKTGKPEDVRLRGLGVIRTKKTDKKRGVLVMDDNFRCAREIASELNMLIEQWRPRLVCFEAASPPQNARTGHQLGLAYGVLAAIVELVASERGLPVVSPSPQQIKKVLCGKRSASKEELTEACWSRLTKIDEGVIDWFEDQVPASQRNHAWDSVGALFASLNSDVLRACIR